MRRPCYIFDIDGTLADCQHRIHHIEGDQKNWRAFFAGCGDDRPIHHMLRLVVDLQKTSTPIIFVSGRSDECRDATISWLLRQGIEVPTPTFRLYMRREGDHRPDDLLKIEMLERARADGWDPIMAFDDRNRVVAAWRAAGVPCAQVAEGDF